MPEPTHRLREHVAELERRFDTLLECVSAELDPASAEAFEGACRCARADLKILSVHVLGNAGQSGPFPALSVPAERPEFALPFGAAAMFLDGLAQVGRSLECLSGLLSDAGHVDSDPLAQAVMCCRAEFWAHAFLHLKLPLWRAFPELNPFVSGLSAAAEEAASATFRIRTG